ALGTAYTPPGAAYESYAIARYSGGRWSVDDQAIAEINLTHQDTSGGNRPVSVAFTSPQDGWLVKAQGNIFHYDGQHWRDCATAPQACGDDPNRPRLPKASTAADLTVQLTTAGRRVYLYGRR